MWPPLPTWGSTFFGVCDIAHINSKSNGTATMACLLWRRQRIFLPTRRGTIPSQSGGDDQRDNRNRRTEYAKCMCLCAALTVNVECHLSDARRACSAHMRILLIERIFVLADMAHLYLRLAPTQRKFITLLAGESNSGPCVARRQSCKGDIPARKSHFHFSEARTRRRLLCS
jgi:hypothetical protein